MIISHLTKRGHSNLKPLINLKELLLDTEKLKRNALERKMNVNVDLIKELNGKRIEMSKELNILNSKRKKINNSISNSNLISSSISNSDSFDRKNLMKKLANVEDDLLREISAIPNWSSEESPLTENKIIKMSPEDFNPSNHARADHVETCKRFDLVDFEGPARTTGAHFYALKGITAMLEIALTAWSMNRAAKKGFVPVSAPDCVREKFVIGCGFQPRRSKVEESSGKKKSNLPVYTVTMPGDTETEDPLILAGTSEIFLASQYTGQTLRSPDLPLKFVGLSHCFRSEVGHHTASSRGLYRVHQFTKIELFVFCDSAHSEDHFHEITGLQGEMLSELKLPFRVLEMGREELGVSAHRKWDHEVWMPGRKMWGEVMSTSNCTDFQSRRLSIRQGQQLNENGRLCFPFTLNGTACAIPRIIMALLEWGWDPSEPNYLNLPIALEPFYPGLTEGGGGLTVRFG